jgi:hypothetical protein
MATIQTQHSEGHQLHEALHLHERFAHVKSLRDDLRAKVSLFEADSKAELSDLEARIDGMERELTAATDDVTGAIAAGLDRLSTGFRHLQRKVALRKQPT